MFSPSSASPLAPRRVAVAGVSGRMGRMLIEAVVQNPQLALVAAFDTPTSSYLNQPVLNLLDRAAAKPGSHTADAAHDVQSVRVESNVAAGLARSQAQVLIDFTRPEGTLAHLAICESLGVQMVIGTTGFSADEQTQIRQAAQKIALVFSPNMSVGVNVTLKLLELAARALPPAAFDVEIMEAHHRHKVDAPSGTALAMGQAVAQASGRVLEDCAIYARQGHTGLRPSGSIGFATVRGGDIIGDHTVLFAGDGERIEISHRSSSRHTYAQGSVRAVEFLRHQSHGLFTMFDVLGLNT
jgi:4-hydroxy-tetrahydrodipicolinate reductase